MKLNDIIFVLKIIETKGYEPCYDYQKGIPCYKRKRSPCPLYKYSVLRKKNAIANKEEEEDLDCTDDLAYESALIEIKKLEITNPELVFEAKIIMSNEE